jgi:hypothetical protein
MFLITVITMSCNDLALFVTMVFNTVSETGCFHHQVYREPNPKGPFEVISITGYQMQTEKISIYPRCMANCLHVMQRTLTKHTELCSTNFTSLNIAMGLVTLYILPTQHVMQPR